MSADRHGFACGHPDDQDLCRLCDRPSGDSVHYRDYLDMVTHWARQSAAGESPARPLPPPSAKSEAGESPAGSGLDQMGRLTGHRDRLGSHWRCVVTRPAWDDVPHEDWCQGKNHEDCCGGECECLRADVLDARSWARHGYEIGQRSCTWSDQGVAPTWLTEGHTPEALAFACPLCTGTTANGTDLTCGDCGRTVPPHLEGETS